jgi:peptidoglycan/xylan/chitin deacetylase (PgdA/CDA1 family)
MAALVIRVLQEWDNGMVRSVIFFSFIFVLTASLALLYTFGLSQLLFVLLGTSTLFIVYLLFHPRNQWMVANRSRVPGACCLALTFDDGPDPVDTPKLLDLLREKGVKATFFVVGKRADQHPGIVRRGRSAATWSRSTMRKCATSPRATSATPTPRR